MLVEDARDGRFLVFNQTKYALPDWTFAVVGGKSKTASGRARPPGESFARSGDDDLEQRDVVRFTRAELLERVMAGEFQESKWSLTILLALQATRGGLARSAPT